jgi:PST family polysaccharide transporter
VTLSSGNSQRATRRQLGRAAVSGIAWGYASYVLSKLLIFVSTVILARLLSPESFGVVGFALIVIGYLDIARDLGVGSALIARPEADERDASMAFVISVGWGVALTVGVYLSAPLFGEFFGDPRAVGVTRVLAFGFLLSTLGSTHDALLYRGLAFNRRIIPDVVQALVKGVVSVALALADQGYWSLVYGQLVGQAAFCVTAWIMQPFRPRLVWDSAVGRWLLGFGSAVVMSRLVASLLTNLGFLVVGGVLGATALGVYTLAYRVPQLLLIQSFGILSTVLFPVYARLQDDQDGLRRGYILAQRYMGLIALPLGFGMAVVAPLFVKVVYGEAWAEAGVVMQLLALRGAISAIGWHAGDIAKAVGRARLPLLLQVIGTVLVAPLLVYSAYHWQLAGLAASYAAGAALMGLLNTVMLRRVVRLPISAALAALAPAVAATLSVVVVTVGFLALSASMSDQPRLIATVALGTLAYFGAIAVVGRDLVKFLPARMRPWRVSPATAVIP